MTEYLPAAIGALAMAISVAMGAFGAHGLKAILTPESLQTWETAARYLAYHGLGLFAVAFLHARAPGRLTQVATALMVLGMVLFSASLFGYALTQEPALAMMAPFGGTSFMAGWLCLAVAAFRAHGRARRAAGAADAPQREDRT